MMGKLSMAVITVLTLHTAGLAQFSIAEHPRVNPADFEVTTFADGLNYPVGMDFLDDGSLIVAVANGGAFFSSTTGRILRFVDEDDDGVAETEQELGQLSIGGPTALQRIDDLLFVTGQGKPIIILRIGPAPDYNLRQIGRMSITGSGNWLHPNSALVARRVEGTTDQFELFFPLGSRVNFALTTATRSLSTDFGLSADLAGDAIHRVRFSDDGTRLTGIDHTLIATGLRSASGLAFHPVTGDLYFEDNGIDGLEEAIEAHSADEINIIPNDQLGGDVEDFGFPFNFVAYRTGEFVGGQGVPPAVAFTPLPNPADGSESEGPNEIAFAPGGFPPSLRHGLFVGFHGQFSRAGLDNEENPLVWTDPQTGEYFHFVGNQEPAVGHLDGLLAGDDHLFVSDISSHGGFGSGAANSGRIYRIAYIGEPTTAVTEVESETPDGFALDEAYPNPFNPATNVTFRIPPAGHGEAATLRVFGVNGQHVATLMSAPASAGTYRADWDGTDDTGRAVASGQYFLHLSVGTLFEASRSVTLLK